MSYSETPGIATHPEEQKKSAQGDNTALLSPKPVQGAVINIDKGPNIGPAPANNLAIKGRFARYLPPFLQLMLPVLSIRYLWVAFENINPRNILDKPLKKAAPVKVEKTALGKTFRYISRNLTALGMGATVLSILSFYSKRTYDDIRTVYAEAVGYELDKKPEEVGMRDIWKSQNAEVMTTRGDFTSRSLKRLVPILAFFVPWQVFRGNKHLGAPVKYSANHDAGIGAVGTYLSMDGFVRKQTFFEAEQEIVDNAINHVDNNISANIRTGDIQTLLMLYRKRHDASYTWPPLDSKEAVNQSVLAGRIADLMNQTYNNTPNTDHAHFTLGKFNYLVGFNMLEKFPESLAFVELASHSSDMKDVKAAANAIKSGQDPRAVFQAFGIDLDRPIKRICYPMPPACRRAKQNLLTLRRLRRR